MEGTHEPVARSLVGRRAGHVLALEDDGAARSRQRAREHGQERRLPRPVGADQAGDLPRRHVDGDAVHGVKAFEVAMDVARDQHRPLGSGRQLGGSKHQRASRTGAPSNTRRDSGRTPSGRNHRNPMISRPMATHWSAGIRPGGPRLAMLGLLLRKRVISSKPTGTSSAPRMAPMLLPRPPTMMAANRMIVSG